jgi:demethylmenaquinone methyltransferase / 2-methoxy-6-polyprenyl-1,4-benzoquinol methylase
MLTQEIKELFEKQASLYDFTNTFLSFGIDDFWRKRVAKSLCLPDNARVADIATGTAEVAIHIAKQNPQAKIVGLDFSPSMLKRGDKKIHKFHYNNIFLLSGDATILPFHKNSFDAITIVFGIRNIINRELALKEFYSVLKPQGQLIIMEFGFPEISLFRSLYLFYFNHLLPWIGNLLVSSDHAYTYLKDSVHKFPAPEQFMETLRSVGFKNIQRLSFTGGIVDLFKASKE